MKAQLNVSDGMGQIPPDNATLSFGMCGDAWHVKHGPKVVLHAGEQHQGDERPVPVQGRNDALRVAIDQ